MDDNHIHRFNNNICKICNFKKESLKISSTSNTSIDTIEKNMLNYHINKLGLKVPEIIHNKINYDYNIYRQ